VEVAYHEHCTYHTEADKLQAWIASMSETLESLTAGIDATSKKQLELALVKLDVLFHVLCFVKFNYTFKCV